MQVSPVRAWVLALLPSGGCSSVVERLLAKEKVESSNLFARSINLPAGLSIKRPAGFVWRRGQVVRQGSAKPSFTGSNPVVALKSGPRLVQSVRLNQSPFSRTNLWRLNWETNQVVVGAEGDQNGRTRQQINRMGLPTVNHRII